MKNPDQDIVIKSRRITSGGVRIVGQDIVLSSIIPEEGKDLEFEKWIEKLEKRGIIQADDDEEN